MLKPDDEPIPGYRLQHFLGRGNFGEVWRVKAPGGTSQALKFIGLGGHQGAKEFRAVQRVKNVVHPNLMPIVALWLLDQEHRPLDEDAIEQYRRVLEQGPAKNRKTLQTHERHPSQLVVAMLLAEKSLGDRLDECLEAQQAGIPCEELLRYMDQAAEGLDFLNSPRHDLGNGSVALQHCDIKPHNILLSGGGVLICDFGLARALGDSRATSMAMTPAYMAPECYQTGQPSAFTDQYSLAITYYELRTGELPFDAEDQQSEMHVVHAHCEGRLELFKLSDPEQSVIRRATSLKPDERFPSTRAFVTALRAATRPEHPATAPVVPADVPSLAQTLPVEQNTTASLATSPGPRPTNLQAEASPPMAPLRWQTGHPGNHWLMAAAVALLILFGGAIAGWMIFRGASLPAPPPAKYAITFEPSDIEVTIDGEPRVLDPQGSIKVKLLQGSAIEIVAKPNRQEAFETFQQAVTIDDLQRWNFLIRLPSRPQPTPPVDFAKLAQQALHKWKSGDFQSAVADYAQAIRGDAKLGHRPEPIILQKHDDRVSRLAISSDSRWLVSTSDDTKARVWDLQKSPHPQPDAVLAGHTDSVDSLLISQNSRWLVTGSWDRTARVWDLNSLTLAATLSGHENLITALAISPDDRWLATASADSTVRRWDLNDDPATCRDILERHSEAVSAIAFDPTGRWFCTGGWDDQVLRWDLAERSRQPVRLGRHKGDVKAMSLLAGGQLLVTAGADGEVWVWDVSMGQAGRELVSHRDSLEVLASSADGRWLAAGAADGAILIWEVEGKDLKLRANEKEHGGAVIALAFSPENLWLASAGMDGSVKIWELAGNSFSATELQADSKTPVNAVVFSQDSRWLATGDDDGVVRIWDYDQYLLVDRARQQVGLDPVAGIKASRLSGSADDLDLIGQP